MTLRFDAARRTRRMLMVASLGILAGMVIIVAVAALRAHERNDILIRICRSQVAQNQVLREVLAARRDQAFSRATSEAEIGRLIKDYQVLFGLVPPLKCDSKGRPIRRH